MRFVFLAILLSASYANAQPKIPVKALNLETVNSPADETDVCVVGNNTTMLFSVNKTKRFEIWMSKRASAIQPWPAPRKLYAEDADLRGAFPFKEWIYFASNKIPDPKFKDLENYDISKRAEELFPVPIPGLASPKDESFPCIALQGKELYFSRKTAEGWKLMLAEGPVPGPIGKAREVGFPANFHHATVSTDGKLMYLEGPLEGDKIGIFRSRRTSLTGAWSQPEAVTGVNHPEAKRDQSPHLSSDGVRLYIASDRPGGKGGLDLWVIQTNLLK